MFPAFVLLDIFYVDIIPDNLKRFVGTIVVALIYIFTYIVAFGFDCHGIDC